MVHRGELLFLVLWGLSEPVGIGFGKKLPAQINVDLSGRLQWLKINYPNRFDAAWGRNNGLLTVTHEREITAAWSRRKLTLGKTPLGGGIGFHGWNEDWDEEGPRHLSWGCIVMQNRDIKAIFDLVPNGTMVVLF